MIFLGIAKQTLVPVIPGRATISAPPDKRKTPYRTGCQQSELIWELGVEIRVRQSPDWRVTRRHSGQWRSRDRRPAALKREVQQKEDLSKKNQSQRSD